MMPQHSSEPEPVAIVGMGCRWPGGVRAPSQFWEYLRDQVDGWKEFDEPRFSTKGYHHPNPDRPGTFSMKGAFLMEEDARLFDHSFFGMTGLEVETLDPSQRKLLEVSYEAIENAGETWDSVSGTRTGVFVGNFCLDHWTIQSRDWDNPRPYAFTGAGTSILANRISYIFNFHGPSLTVDTACSSSMYALHLAVNAIRAGDCDSAIVAAANWVTDPTVQIALDKLGALSASSRCHTFDARAEGYARGEGFAAIYLKRTSLAVADESPIRAVIRGTAVNSNGRTGGITRPSAKGQEEVIREAYRNAGNLSFSDTSYFECHGTGTYVGDPIEVAAVGNAFGAHRSADDHLLVGSVKSNVGHGEGASALAAIMKVVLSLENGAIPPIFDLQTLNPNIDFDGAKVRPVTELTPWPTSRLRRASINSFGYGGANGHCIIDHVNIVLPNYVAPGIFNEKTQSAANGHVDVRADRGANGLLNGLANGLTNGLTNGQPHAEVSDGHYTDKQGRESVAYHPMTEVSEKCKSLAAQTRQWVLLPLSAHNEASLKSNVEALSQCIDRLSSADVAYTLSTRRSRLSQRTFAIVDRDHVADSLAIGPNPSRAPLHTSTLGFIFTGQGAQWHAMGAELFEYHIFRTSIEYLDGVLGLLPDKPQWSLAKVLSGDCDEELIQTAVVSQPACTAVQIGLVDLLASWSVKPAGVAGHSSGEIAAAYASGRVTAAEAILAAFYRGKAVSKNKQRGAMLAVSLTPDDTAANSSNSDDDAADSLNPEDEAAKILEGRENEVKLAAINSKSNVTLSGDAAAVEAVSASLTAENTFNRVLKTDGNAYHSHHMIPLGQEYIKMLKAGLARIHALGLIGKQQLYPHLPWVSSVEPSKSADGQIDLATYGRANLESPVRFSEAVAGLLSMDDVPIHAIVEIGPHHALKYPLQETFEAEGKTVAYCSTLKRKEDSRLSMLRLAGTLFSLNANVDLAAVNATDDVDNRRLLHGCTSIDLPPYQYTYDGLNYHESRASKEYRSRSPIRHDLLGSKVVGNAKLRPQWRNILRMKDVPWLADHRLLPDAVLPGAGFVALAIEAATRIHNEFPNRPKIDGFSLRNVAIRKSLFIPEDDQGIEVLTSLEVVDTSTAQSPAWASFSISSVNNQTNEWTEHCTGLIQVEVEDTDAAIEDIENVVRTMSRPADTQAWYRKFAAVGLGYGPSFQPLSNIRVDPESHRAAATLALNTTDGVIEGGESRYVVHPASLDGVIQLGLIACHHGRSEDASTAFVPVQVPYLYLRNREFLGDTCTAVARGERRGVRGASLDLQLCASNGEVILQAENVRCMSYSSEAKVLDRIFTSPFTRLAWKPDFRMLNYHQAQQRFPPPDENVDKVPLWAITNRLAYFVVYSIYETFGKRHDGPKPSGDVGHFFDWINRMGQNDHSDLMEEARRSASQDRLLESIDELVDQASEVVEVRAAKLLHDNMSNILHERRTGVDVLIEAGLLTPLYQDGLLMTGIYPQLYHVLDGLAYTNPNLRILEIGGGTGGATRVAMRAFSGPNGIKAYQDYTFTDISAGFLSSARESLADFRDMAFAVFDAEVSPEEQGYEQIYDLVIACQVLHATANMQNTLSNCRKLLRPGGKLVLVETNQNFVLPGVVVGTLTGYWAGIPDGRVDAPFQSLDAWDTSLRNAGFSGLDMVLDDFPAPYNTTSVILSTVSREEAEQHAQQPVHVLYSSQTPPTLVTLVAEDLEQHNIQAKTESLGNALDVITPNSRVVALLDEEHLLVNVNPQYLKVMQHLARSAATLLVLTSCGVVGGRNPDGALISGLLRVLQNENSASQYTSIDIDAENFDLKNDEGKQLARSIVDLELVLYQDFETGADEDNAKDREFCWRDGCIWVSRHAPDAGFHSENGVDSRSMIPKTLPLKPQGAIRSTFETPGVLNSLCFQSFEEMSQPVPPNFIDIEVAAVGLNWRDLDRASGRLDDDNLSSEYAGIVSAIGSQVDGLQVGDRVYGLGKGQLGNFTRVPAAFANKLQPNDNLVQMATMPLAYVIAIYTLDHVVQLQPGMTVLVLSGTSDVGLASTLLAKAKGAEVFATVETTEQANFLENEIPGLASNIITAPTLPLLRRAAGTTRKGGFDVIVSTSENGLFYSSVPVLAPLGFLVDAGRIDAQSAQTSVLDLSLKNASYRSVDPWLIFDSDPSLGRELVKAVDAYYRQGLIGPLKANVSDVSELSQAFDKFPGIMGKLVATFTDPESLIRMIPRGPTVRFDPEAYYVITGALGGLGQALIRWMTVRGARHLALLSRRDISSVPEAEELVASLKRRHVHITSAVCDISDKEQVARTIVQISSARPIKGIVHAAVSYLDLSFDKLSAETWNDGLSAKVTGTKNLHETTLSMPLDFFVMVTSALSVYAFPTQAAYTAANNFQDAFARHRRHLGLPASTVSFSLVEAITDVGTDAITNDLFKRNQAVTIGESQFLTLLEPAFLDNHTAIEEVQGQWLGHREDVLSAANLHTYLDPAAMLTKRRQDSDSGTALPSTAPPWHSDGRVSLMMRAFTDAQRHSEHLLGAEGGSQNTVAHLRREFDALVEAGADERTQTVEFVRDAIVNAAAERLFVDVESIDSAKSIADIGADSLIAAELRSWFNKGLGKNISMLDLLDPSLGIAALAANIVDEALAAKTES